MNVLLLAGFLLMMSSPSYSLHVVCVGDSITAGYTIPNSNEYYPQVVATLSNWTVDNQGNNGKTMQRRTPDSYWLTSNYNATLYSRADVIVIMLGTNDAKISEGYWNATDFRNDTILMINTFRNLSSHPIVFINTSPYAYNSGAYSIDPPTVNEQVVPLQRMIAAEMGCPLIDINNVTANHSALFPDNIHPNATGAALIANAVYRGIRDYLYPSTTHARTSGHATTAHTSAHTSGHLTSSGSSSLSATTGDAAFASESSPVTGSDTSLFISTGTNLTGSQISSANTSAISMVLLGLLYVLLF